MAPLTLTVDALTSVVGKTMTILIKHAGVADEIAVAAGAPEGGACSIDAPDAGGVLDGLVTVAKYVCSRSPRAAVLMNSKTPEGETFVTEWINRATTEYAAGVTHEAFDALNEHLLPRSFIASDAALSLADVLAYASLHAPFIALGAERHKALVNVMRWMDHVGAVTGGDASGCFGPVPIVHQTFTAHGVEGLPMPDLREIKERYDAEAAARKKEGGGKEGKEGKPKKEGKLSKDERRGIAPKSKEKKTTMTMSDGRVIARPGGAKKPEEGGEGGGGGGGAAEGGDAKKEKKETKAKAPPEAKPQATKKAIDVSVLDIRVGTIVKAWEHPGADKLWVESVELGEERPRQIVSGLRAFKTEAQMTGARVLVLCNVKKGPLREELSEGMVMCASNADHTEVDFIVPPEGVPNGEKVAFEGFDGEPVDVLTPKKKMFEQCAEKLSTDADGVAKYDGVPFMTSKGPCVSTLKNAAIK